MCYLMTTFRCPSDILITSCWLEITWSRVWLSWLDPASRFMHPGLHHSKCFFYPSGLSLCLTVDQFCFVPVDDVVLFHSMVLCLSDGWLVRYSPLLWRLGSVYQRWKSPPLSCAPWSSYQTSCPDMHESAGRRIQFPPTQPHTGQGDFQVTCSIEL